MGVGGAISLLVGALTGLVNGLGVSDQLTGDAIGRLPGVTAYPSRANFILLRVDDAAGVFERLKQRKVLVKNLHGSHPLLAGCLRVTVGMPRENQMFLSALGDSL